MARLHTREKSLRYLTGSDVESLLPPIQAQLALAAHALRALPRNDAELPPRSAVYPSPGAFLHAMPAHLRSDRVVGIKWIGGSARNKTSGLPYIHALIVLNDPLTAAPLCILEGARITAARTAAVTGVAVSLFAATDTSDAWEVAILGAGVQARAHIPVLGTLLPGMHLRIFDHHPERAAALAEWAMSQAGVSSARAIDMAGGPRAAVAGAQVVLTAAATVGITPSERPTQLQSPMRADWLGTNTLVVAIDFTTYVTAEVVLAAAAFVIDDYTQYLVYRSAGRFPGYPETAETLGDVLERGGLGKRVTGPIVVSTIGIGLADILFAHAIYRRAEASGRGMLLPR